MERLGRKVWAARSATSAQHAAAVGLIEAWGIYNARWRVPQSQHGASPVLTHACEPTARYRIVITIPRIPEEVSLTAV